jgi:hypothetical protein
MDRTAKMLVDYIDQTSSSISNKRLHFRNLAEIRISDLQLAIADKSIEFKPDWVGFHIKKNLFCDNFIPKASQGAAAEVFLKPQTALNLIYRLGYLPVALKEHVDDSGTTIIYLGRKLPRARALISVVVPVFNESKTVERVLNALLNLEIEDSDLEIVVVESNSTDGSRGIVESYSEEPKIRIIFEDKPRGKGHAVRRGLAETRGEIIIIQDADLEYDIEDYHLLLNPILSGQQALVLGSRHGGKNHWKLRSFQKPLLSFFYNMAHVLVTSFINILFQLKLNDPQTMFKVFRRDCIEGLDFRCNYFDFDYELLLKIVRKGYKPVEVPVNYTSRSHAEGKKISMWRDAPLGILAIIKMRFTPLRKFLKIGDPVSMK